MFFKKSYSNIYLLFFILMGVPDLYGQNTLSVRERFQVDYTKGCAPLTVEIIEEDFSQLPNYDPDADYVRWYGYRSTNPAIEPLPPAPENGRELRLPEAGEYYIIQLLQNEGKDSLKVIVHENVPPIFEASNCGNNTISVKVNPENHNYDYYRVTIDGQEEEIAKQQNDYTVFFSDLSAGAASVRVKGMYQGNAVDNNCGASPPKDIQVSATLEPANILHMETKLQENSIHIRYQLQQDVLQILEVSTTGLANFIQYARLEGDELLIEDLDPANNFYCFRIRTPNLCEPGQEQLSNTICSATLTGSSSAEGNEIDFSTASAEQDQAILLRDEQEIHQYVTLTQGSFQDAEVVCGTAYSYSIKLVYPNGRESLTEGLELTNQYSATLAAPENISSYWENNSPHFEIQLDNEPQQGQYSAYTETSPTPAISSDSSLLQLTNKALNSCYRFAFTDACGNESELSQEVCALYLSNNTTQPDVLNLQWNEYTGYKEGVRTYVLNKYNPDGSFEASYPMGLQTSIDLGEQPLQEEGSIYMVSAFSWDGTEESYSNPYVLDIEIDAYFPNAFTPDGDGINDQFKVEGKFVESGELEIYNRWGEQIFVTRDLENGWDGKAKGQAAPTGTYIYKAVVETIDGRQQSRQGTIFLIRK